MEEKKQTYINITLSGKEIQELLENNIKNNLLKIILTKSINQLMEQQRDYYVSVGDYERSWNRVSYRNGYYERDYKTRVGTLEFLVHEGPQSISQRYIDAPLEEGMITSNEPGFYVQGKYGIRIENLILTKKARETDFGKFYEFETLTLCPISTKPVKKEMLSETEIKWLNDYNANCFKLLSKHLNDEEKAFLKNECTAI